VVDLCSIEARLDMDENQLLSTLPDPEFTEALDVINGYTTEQKRRHAYDMRENYQRILASYKATDSDKALPKTVLPSSSLLNKVIF
jgi:hypothetical protein